MSFNVLLNRPRSYVLGVSDLGKYVYAYDGSDEDSAPMVVDPSSGWQKARPLSAYVLCLGGANGALLDEFHAKMDERLDFDQADFDDCYATAREVVEEMRASDEERPGVPPWLAIETGGLAIVLTGFRRDGTTAVAAWSAGGPHEDNRAADPDGWETLSDADVGEANASLPWGVPTLSLLPFYAIAETPELCADAMRHVFDFWSGIYNTHPDRITSEMAGWILLWGDDGPTSIMLTCDTQDADEFARLYVQLQLITAIRAAAGSFASVAEPT